MSIHEYGYDEIHDSCAWDEPYESPHKCFWCVHFEVHPDSKTGWCKQGEEWMEEDEELDCWEGR